MSAKAERPLVVGARRTSWLPLRTGRVALGTLVLAAACVTALGACGEDSPMENNDDDTIFGIWDATSFNALGTDFIDTGLTVVLNLTGSGQITIDFAGDLLSTFCDTGTTCTQSGDYVATETTITVAPGTEDELTFNYTLSGDTMTWTGLIDNISATIVFSRR